MNRKEETSAVKLQYWWRSVLRSKQRTADRAKEISEWRGLTNISLHNDQLIQQLRVLRREKACDIHKYETILHLPAKDVNDFLRQEAEFGSSHVIESEQILERALDKQRHRAAAVIQRTFREHYLRRKAQAVLRGIVHIRPSRRAELLSEIGERLAKNKNRRNHNLTSIKNALREHKEGRLSDIRLSTERDYMITNLKRDMMFLQALTSTTTVDDKLIKCFGSSRSPLSEYKAAKKHEAQMQDILDDML